MRIVSLVAENYKRLRAVEITPEGDLVVVGGRNAQGKSSVLDAIWAALGGREGNKTAKPIREGEESARVTVDLGDIIVTRTWRGEYSTVKVESADGAVFKSPQALLDGLVGRLSFDPLAFTRLKEKEQREALLNLVELDLNIDELDAKRARLYDDRTEVGRQEKAIGEVPIVADLPTVEQSASELIRAIQDRQAHNRAVDAAEAELDRSEAAVESLTEQIAALQVKLEEARVDVEAAADHVQTLGNRETTADLEQRLASVEETNAAIRANNHAREQHAQKNKLSEQYDDLTSRIRDLDKKKAAALSKAQFPVDGLGFDDTGVTFNGVPFSQASSAEQIRVSLAMAIAANPRLRVVRIMDGSLLDGDNLKLITQIAADNDMQVWIERVGSDRVGVIIEDGQVAA
ncbi:AAA family ATPase [Microbacterium sp. YY-01]|uniref:AAA family ATPase n=1 Tax=Microbacterium sp. YY-01 TaxID=3421634 RepID=UPI003D18208B